MPRRLPTRSPLAILALIWLVGTGLWFAPARAVNTVRGAVRDVLVPGQCGVQLISNGIADTWQERCSTIARNERRRNEELEHKAAFWRHRALSLQVRTAELSRQLEQADDAEPPFPVAAGEPLLMNTLIEARVLGSARSNLEQRLRPIIDRGSADEVDVDDIVLADDRLHLDQGLDAGIQRDSLVLSGMRIAGRVEQVGRWTSTIQPLTDEAFRGVAQLVREGSNGPVYGAEGILAGNGDGTCRLELIAASHPVAVGDTVFLPGHRTGLPGSACYGRVVEATLEESSAWWSIQVAPEIEPGGGEHLQVLLETANPRRIAYEDHDVRVRERTD